MYRNLWGLLAVFAVGFVLVGLTFSTSTDEGADFTFVSGSEPASLDPQVMTGQLEGRLSDALFEGLTYRDPKTLEPTPGCAESWEMRPDGKEYVFKIRKGLAWSDGTPINAHDFAWSWRRLQEPKLGSQYAYILHMVKHARAMNEYGGHAEKILGEMGEAVDGLLAANPEGIEATAWQAWLREQELSEVVRGAPDAGLREILREKEGWIERLRLEAFAEAFAAEGRRRKALNEEALEKFGRTEGAYARDDYTFVVELEAPTPYFMDLTCFYTSFPVPRHVVELKNEKGEVVPDAWAKDWFLPHKIVTNGPFLLDDWQVNARIRIRKNPDYWNADSIRIETIDALPIDTPMTALNLYLRGNVDWNTSMPPDIRSVLKDRDDHYARPGFIVYYYRFNCTHEILKNKLVRKAICMAVDRDPIVRNVGQLGQPPAYHLIPPFIPAYDPPESHIRYDPEEARRLLAEAGFPNGRGIGSIDLLFNTNENHRQIAELVADQLRRNLGLDVVARNQEWQAYLDSQRSMQYDIARAGWIGDYLDPNTFLDLWVTNGGNNQTGWSNGVYDDLLRYAGNPELLLEEDFEALKRVLKEPEVAEGLLATLRDAGDPAASRQAAERLRMQLFREAEAIIVQDEFPIMPIYFYVTENMVKPHVRGWYSDLETSDGDTKPNVKDIHPLRGIWIEKE